MKTDQAITNSILDILCIPSNEIICTAGMDAKVILWDLTTHHFKKELTGHNRGVYSLAWCEIGSCLLSAGLDHDVFVWNPYCDKRI